MFIISYIKNIIKYCISYLLFIGIEYYLLSWISSYGHQLMVRNRQMSVNGCQIAIKFISPISHICWHEIYILINHHYKNNEKFYQVQNCKLKDIAIIAAIELRMICLFIEICVNPWTKWREWDSNPWPPACKAGIITNLDHPSRRNLRQLDHIDINRLFELTV